MKVFGASVTIDKAVVWASNKNSLTLLCHSNSSLLRHSVVWLFVLGLFLFNAESKWKNYLVFYMQ